MRRHTCAGLACTLIALGLAISTHPGQGQTMSFFRQFTTPGIDREPTVAADASGIYVFGNRLTSEGRPNSAGIRKYDSRGNELWTREFSASADGSAPRFSGAAADVTATGVYVVGTTLGVTFVRKYDAGGSELWTRQLEFGPIGGSMAVDATGVYLAGLDHLPFDVRVPSVRFVRKYGPDGVELWTSRTPQNPGLLEHPQAVAADDTGVYVLERIANGRDGLMRKYDPRGSELWTRPLDFQPSRATASHPTGLFVTGERALVRKYDGDGNELWGRQIDAPPSGVLAGGVSVDATGVYVAGLVPARPFAPWNALPGQCRSGNATDAFVRKYDPNGAELWTREFGTPYCTSVGGGVAVDASGVYLAGEASFPERSGFLAKFEKSPDVIAASRPRIVPGCVVNAASYVGGGVAPGEIVTLFGSAMGPAELVQWRLTGEGRLATTLADTRILFNGVPAPLLYVSDRQGSAVVPYAVAGQTSVEVQVEYKGVRSEAVTMPVLAARPGIFSLDGSGQGRGAILNEDGNLNSPSNPARRGSIVTIYATGGGESAPGVADGQILNNVLPRVSLPVSVLFGLYPDTDQDEPNLGEVLYAGGSPGSVAGLLQVNVRVPLDAPTRDAVNFALIIGSGGAAYQITIALR